MNLRGCTPRSLGLLFLGAALLPLLVVSEPAAAPPVDQPAEPAAKPIPLRRYLSGCPFLDGQSSMLPMKRTCASCHQPASSRAGAGRLHEEIVRLWDERDTLRGLLRKNEIQLRDALARMEKAQGKGPTGAAEKVPELSEKRLEKLEKSLKRILEEVESLRREIRPAGKAPPKAPSGQASYINKRSFKLPVKWSRQTLQEARLYVSSDGGRNWSLEARSKYPQESLPFVAPRDGTYCFTVQAVSDSRDADEKPDLQPMLTVVVDTKKPVIELSVGQSGKHRGVIEWQISDENLDPATLRVEYRERGQSDWRALPVELRAAGRYVLPGDPRPGEVRVSVADRAGNSETCRMTME
jgi:hypothetical protein